MKASCCSSGLCIPKFYLALLHAVGKCCGVAPRLRAELQSTRQTRRAIEDRFLQFPQYQDGAKETANRTVRNFYLSLLHAVGDNRDNFGELNKQMPTAAQAGPLAEIMA